MTDVETALRRVESHPSPYLWGEITERARTPRPPIDPGGRPRTAGVVAAVATLLVIALLVIALYPFRHNGSPAAGPAGGDLLVTFRADITSRSSQVWSVHSDGSGGQVFIDDGPAVFDEQAAWSPDGSKVAFLRGSEGNGGVWVVNADGTNARQLAPDVAAQEPAWSPDGRTIAFANEGTADGSTGAPSVDIVDVQSGQVRTVARGDFVHPNFSPDGGQLVMVEGFYGTGNGTALEVVNVDGSSLHRITALAGRYWEAAWDPSGEWIATQWSNPDGPSLSTDIWLLRTDGSDRTRLTDHFGWDGAPVWSPDGSRIAFDSDRCADPADVRHWAAEGTGPWRTCVYVIDADGSHVHEVFERGTFQNVPTSWRAMG